MNNSFLQPDNTFSKILADSIGCLIAVPPAASSRCLIVYHVYFSIF